MSPKKYVVLAKIEVTQFTDPVPTASANAILCKNLTYTPLRVESEDRAIQRPYFGNSEQLPILEEAVVEFDVEMAGSGAAGTAPKWGPLVRACAFAEVIVASTSVTYNPVSSALESITLYINRDGRRGKLLGAMGNVTVNMSAKKIPELHFRFVGRYDPISDSALPTTPDYTGFQTPKASIPAWTGTLTLNSIAIKTSAVSVDMANEVSHALWMNLDTLDITDRKPKGSISMRAEAIATIDPFTLVRNATLVPFTLTHGTVAGNIVTIAAPKVQLVDHAEETFENTMVDRFNTTLNPDTGNDEFTIACT